MKDEPILLSVQQIPIQPANKAKRFLIFLNFLFTLPQSNKLVDDNGTDQLINDDLNDEQVDEVNEDVLKFFCFVGGQDSILIISVSHQSCICSETVIKRKYKAVIQCFAFNWVI